MLLTQSQITLDDRGSGRLDLDAPALKTCVHIVTLINRRTEDEQTLRVVTLTDRFTDVIREIAHQKVLHGLMGYEIWETLSEPGF